MPFFKAPNANEIFTISEKNWINDNFTYNVEGSGATLLAAQHNLRAHHYWSSYSARIQRTIQITSQNPDHGAVEDALGHLNLTFIRPDGKRLRYQMPFVPTGSFSVKPNGEVSGNDISASDFQDDLTDKDGLSGYVFEKGLFIRTGKRGPGERNK